MNLFYQRWYVYWTKLMGQVKPHRAIGHELRTILSRGRAHAHAATQTAAVMASSSMRQSKTTGRRLQRSLSDSLFTLHTKCPYMQDFGHFSLVACDDGAVSAFAFPFSNLPLLTHFNDPGEPEVRSMGLKLDSPCP